MDGSLSRRPHRRRGTAGGNALISRLDRLITLVAERRRIEAVERPLRSRIAAEMAAHARQGGPDQFRRPGGLISLVAPRPRWDVFDQQAFTDWLVSNGHSHLVTERVVVTDHASLSALLKDTQRSGRVSRRKLSACVEVRLQAYADAPEHLDVTVGDEGRLLTRDGQAIPGVRGVMRDPWVQVCAAASTSLLDAAASGGER
ncbi:MAG: hypothetical protein ACRD0K_05045 [Egibacteraceae bacterium]